MFDDAAINQTKSPPHMGEVVKAKVLSVYDCDTCTVAYNINNNSLCPFIVDIRFANIDGPEKRTLNKLEKEACILVTKYVSDMILNTEIDLEIVDWDKYGGRVVGIIHTHDINLNSLLLEKGLVKSYSGNVKKEPWTEGELRSIIAHFDK
jgi:endonuclease YncB( thermonuclease family)